MRNAESLSNFDYSPEEKSFSEEVKSCGEDIEKILRDHRHGYYNSKPERENFLDKKSELEEKYISLVCNCSEQEYFNWERQTMNEIVERMKTGKNSEELFEMFQLFKSAKTNREEF